MKLTWHVIKKDLYQFRWSLVLWLSCFTYLVFFQERVGTLVNTESKGYLQLLSMLIMVVLSCAMLISIIQQDHPVDSSAFWRTRPISAHRLVAAKLLLLFALFVGIPFLTVLLWVWTQDLVRLNSVREYSLMVLVLSSLVLSLAAAAACTRNIAYALLLWLGAIFGSGTLADILGHFLPKLTLQLSQQMNMNRILTVLALSMAFNLAIILNQYLRRRLSVSAILIVAGNVSIVLVATLWSYYYFYQG